MDESTITLVLAALVLVAVFSNGPADAWLPGMALIPLASKVPYPL